MTHRRVELGVWIAAIMLAVLAGVRARAAAAGLSSPTMNTVAGDAGRSAPSLLAFQPAVLADAAEAFVAGDPFRLDRKPSDVPYSPGMEGVPAPQRPPRPSLAIVGIVGGPPWEALVEGIPGRQGSVLVRRGDTLSGLRIRSITKDIVRISGMDTTWTLPVRRAWQ